MRKTMGLILLLASSCLCPAQTIVEVQPVIELKPTGSLSTCGYAPTEKENPFFKKLSSSEKTTGSFLDEKEYRIRGKRNKFESWFGVVRGVSRQQPGETAVQLLLEQKYFDGMTDCHIMLVSQAGGGDFVALLKSDSATIPALSLVRAYGTVVEEKGGIPYLAAEFIRVWPWFTFTLTDLGPTDHGNPRWQKYCKVCPNGRIYNPYPTEDYYLGVLGDPKDFGTMLNAQPQH